MKYGFFIRGQFRRGEDMNARFADLCAQARLADALGFDLLATGMHYAAYPLQQYQQLPLLARLMVEAPRCRLLPGIILLSLHKPLDIAEQVATLDVMSGGRMIFGAGLGYREVEFKGFGTTQAERVMRLEENLEAIVRLWTEDGVTMAGSHFTLDDATVSLKPMQKPHPPIWLGANADAAVERAARLGDTWFINPHQRMETTERQLVIYRRALDAAKRPFPAELPLMREIFVARTREEAERLARPYLEEKYKTYHAWGQDKAMPAGDDDLSLDFEELMRDRFLFGSPQEVAEADRGLQPPPRHHHVHPRHGLARHAARAGDRQHAALRRRGGAAGRRRRLGRRPPAASHAMAESLHHVHIFARDIEATIAWWRDMLGGEVVHDGVLAGARNVFMRIGSGGLHLYDQPPRDEGRGAVHHIGIRSDDLRALVARLTRSGVPFREIREFGTWRESGVPFRSEIREFGTWRYIMCAAPDDVLLELFEFDPTHEPAHARRWLREG